MSREGWDRAGHRSLPLWPLGQSSHVRCSLLAAAGLSDPRDLSNGYWLHRGELWPVTSDVVVKWDLGLLDRSAVQWAPGRVAGAGWPAEV